MFNVFLLMNFTELLVGGVLLAFTVGSWACEEGGVVRSGRERW